MLSSLVFTTGAHIDPLSDSRKIDLQFQMELPDVEEESDPAKVYLSSSNWKAMKVAAYRILKVLLHANV